MVDTYPTGLTSCRFHSLLPIYFSTHLQTLSFCADCPLIVVGFVGIVLCNCSTLPSAYSMRMLYVCVVVFIKLETPRCSNQLSLRILLPALLMQDQNIHQLNAHGCHHHCRKDRELCYALGGVLLLKRIMNAMRIAMQTCMVAG